MECASMVIVMKAELNRQHFLTTKTILIIIEIVLHKR